MTSQKSDWKFPKIHAISHYKEDIMRSGVTENYSAEMWEMLHKVVMKKPWLRTNRKNVEDQMMNVVDEMNVLSSLDEGLLEEKEDISVTTYIDKADVTGTNVLPQTKFYVNLEMMKVGHINKDKWKRFEGALSTYLSNEIGTFPGLPQTVKHIITPN